MNIWIILGAIWLMTSIFNYHMLPEDLKQKTNFAAFIIFAVLSPIVTIGVLFDTYVVGNK